MKPHIFDEASGGGGHFWLQNYGVFTATVLIPTRLVTDVGIRIFEYSWVEYEGEEAMGFNGWFVSGPTDLFEMPIVGVLIRPSRKTIKGYIYRNQSD